MAIVVLVFAIVQRLGLVLIYQGKSRVEISRRGSETVIAASLDTTASAERVWQIMSHQESYADVAENLSKAEIVEGEGEGMIRQCWDTKGKSWRETCTRWVEGRAFAVQPKPRIVHQPLFKLMAAQFASVCDRLLQRWVEIMEDRSGERPDSPVTPLRTAPST